MDQFEAARDGDLQQWRVALTVGNVNDDERGLTALPYAGRSSTGMCVNIGAHLETVIDALVVPRYTLHH
jgi:hypothetical protein